MKILILIIYFCTVCSNIYSQQLTYSKDYNGDIIAKDEHGNIVAKGSPNYNGDFVWKDQYGNIIKTESKNFNGNNVTKDQYGNIQSIESLDYNGNTVLKDQNGNILYTLSKDFNGNTVKKDKNGNILGTFKYDYNGNLNFVPNSQQSASPYNRMNDYSVQYFKPFDPGYDRMIDQIKNSERQMAYEETLNPGKEYMIGYGWVTPQQMQDILERKRLEIIAHANTERVKKELKKLKKTEKSRNSYTPIKKTPENENYSKFLPRFGHIIDNKSAVTEQFDGTYRFQYVDLGNSKFKIHDGLEITFNKNKLETINFKNYTSLGVIYLDEYDFNSAQNNILEPCRLFKIYFLASNSNSKIPTHIVVLPCLEYVKVK